MAAKEAPKILQLGDEELIATSAQSTCRLCGSADLSSIYAVHNIPVHSCVLMKTREEATTFPTRDLELAFCQRCGFVFNRLFDEAVMVYSTNFEESQHFSGTFNNFAKELARDIAERCDTQGKRVLEIGCGKGEFLLELCDVGDCTGIGIDPGFRNDRIQTNARVEFLQERFGPQHYPLEADIVLCRHTLEHICDVANFIRSIRDMIGAHEDVAVVFETPDAERVLREGAFWDIYYEHCSYFSAGTHARLFRQSRFDVNELRLVYDNQYILQTARPVTEPSSSRLPLEQDLEELRDLAASFPEHVAAIQQQWRDLISQRARNGERIVLWGGGSKAVSFLTTLGLRDEIDCVVDVNPYKQGKYIPGTGHEVIAPRKLQDKVPSLVIVMNPIYQVEIGHDLRRMDMHPEVLAV